MKRIRIVKNKLLTNQLKLVGNAHRAPREDILRFIITIIHIGKGFKNKK